jgi:hypothetical protein
MNAHEFWEMIEDGVDRNDPTELDVSALEEALQDSSPEEIVDYATHFERLLRLSYTNDLWGAAYIINGGCSDDGFEYFRGWLIGMGREAFEEALEDPDSLIEVAVPDVECEDILYAHTAVYEDLTGEEMPELDLDDEEPPDDDEDEWDFDDDAEMKKRYPQLFKKFCS